MREQEFVAQETMFALSLAKSEIADQIPIRQYNVCKNGSDNQQRSPNVDAFDASGIKAPSQSRKENNHQTRAVFECVDNVDKIP